MHRRHFLGLSAAAAFGGRPLLDWAESPRTALWRPPDVQPTALVLRAQAHPIPSASGRTGTAWTPGAGATGPTIRVQRGQQSTITLENALDEPTILHWHGLRVAETADGHPRLAIPPGARYEYSFEVGDRAGTYWYHAHPHHRTGEQVYRGMAGLFLVEDEEERRVGFPPGAREIGLLVQDRRIAPDGDFAFAPAGHERMEGFFGDTPFVNGTPWPSLDVEAARYRLRVVNVTSARITRLALSSGAPMTLVGVDGGLLPAPVDLTQLDLGTGERADVLVDFSALAEGSRVTLKSLPFTPPRRGMGMGMGMGRMGAGGLPQGSEMDLLEFVVGRTVRERPRALGAFPTIARLDPSRAARTREFHFQSAMMRHTINNREFAIDRVDERVPFGSTEIWRFVNDSPFPHPVHMHAVHFQVLSRTGGRGQLFPWEGGWKDTVLLFPGETVDVIAEFNQHRGLYLMHCHNLVHEDMGMMLNFTIE